MLIPETYAHHRTNVLPLRWFANICGSLASGSLLRIMYAEEDGRNEGLRYKLDSYIWNNLFKIYTKYGTTYRFFNDLSGKNWDDYDENGIPYWERTGTIDPDYPIFNDDYNDDCMPCCANLDGRHCTGCMDCDNDFLDDETGDAFRLIRKDIQ